MSPRGDMGLFFDLGKICPSPLFSRVQLKFLQTWSPKVNNLEALAAMNAPTVGVSDQLKPIQSLDVARVSHSECMSASVSGDSEPSSSNELVKVGTNESTGLG